MLSVEQLNTIKEQIQSGKFTESFRELTILLNDNPNDKEITKLYEKVKAKIYSSNVEKVDTAIENAEHLWNEKKYSELLSIYIKLASYVPNYNRLKKLIQKTYDKLKANSNEQNKEYLENCKQLISTAINEQNYAQALKIAENAIFDHPENPMYQMILIDTKRLIVDAKLKKNKDNIEQNTITETYDFIKKLYEFEPTYERTHDLLLSNYKKLKQYYDEKQKIFERDAERQIKILYNTKEFEKSEQAARELLRINPQSNYAKKYITKCKQKIEEDNFKKAYAKLEVSM